MTTAIAMGLDYLFELILFGPVLALAAHCEKRDWKRLVSSNSLKTPLYGWRLQIDTFMNWVLKMYCRILEHRCFTVFLAVALVAYWYFAIIGALNIKTRLDTAKILPKDSPIQAPNRILSDIIWVEYHPATILVNKPLDIRKRRPMERFWQLVDDFESLPQCRANTETGLDFDKLEEFLESPFYKHWNTFVKVVRTKEGIRVNRFWFTVAYSNTSTWEDLNVTVWEANGMFVDQMLSLKTVAIQTGALTLICMAVVCAVFIPNPCSVITASIAIASISLGVFGFLSWWHFDLDPVTTAAVLMSIGLSVDFTAHLTNRRVIRNKQIVKIPIKGPREKLEHTLRSVGWPMIQAAASTSYSPMVFFKTIILVVCWGLLHGLIVLPALLGALPDCLTNANCYRIFLSTSSQKSCRYVAPQEMEPVDGQEMETNE
ncbi:unnamed protein product [Gongylonema pulchrum]|uniref:SSD domain-containing protein n=1 Tax=Gongylonema pulchrum TaxID=637853 RepID=A0A183ED89_9BILA|nr:unnamed protein product [Gongylonema pulchrum]